MSKPYAAVLTGSDSGLPVMRAQGKAGLAQRIHALRKTSAKAAIDKDGRFHADFAG